MGSWSPTPTPGVALWMKRVRMGGAGWCRHDPQGMGLRAGVWPRSLSVHIHTGKESQRRCGWRLGVLVLVSLLGQCDIWGCTQPWLWGGSRKWVSLGRQVRADSLHENEGPQPSVRQKNTLGFGFREAEKAEEMHGYAGRCVEEEQQ